MYKVLLIDDEEIVREGLIKSINWSSMSCEVVGEAEDGNEGLKLVSILKPDIVFTDIKIPGIDGLSMISKINELRYGCKIIILTGFRKFEYAQEAVRLGVFRFLLKPSKSEEIIITVTEAIEEIKRSRQKENLYLGNRNSINYCEFEKTDIIFDEPTLDNNNHSKYLTTKALNYMKANYAKNPNLKTVAEELYISTWYLSKLLKKETGCTFIDILNKIKVQEAKRLFHNPKYKVYEIAEIVGFTDIPYFTKIFKKITGFTPMEYRNNLF